MEHIKHIKLPRNAPKDVQFLIRLKMKH